MYGDVLSFFFLDIIFASFPWQIKLFLSICEGKKKKSAFYQTSKILILNATRFYSLPIFLWWFFCVINFRCHYLSNAVLQAKNASTSDGLVNSTRGAVENGLLDLLEGKLAVLRFQIKIKEELEAKASRLEASSGASDTVQNGTDPESTALDDANLANNVREKAKELSLDLKSITQLYNDYAVPFELWEVLGLFIYLFIFG